MSTEATTTAPAVVDIPAISCPAVLLPTKADLTQMGKDLACMPGKLRAMIETQAVQLGAEAVEQLEKEIEQIEEVVDLMRDIAGGSAFDSFQIKEWEIEMAFDKMFQKFPVYVQTEILKIISKVLPIDFNIPIPGLGISVDLLKFVSDPDYKANLRAELTGFGDNIKAQIAELDPEALGAEKYMEEVNRLRNSVIDPLYELLPDEWKSFSGEFGMEITELKGEALMAYIESKLSGGALGLLFDAFGGLISKFSKIWDLLGLPALPIPLTLDVSAMIKAIVDAERAKFQAELDKLDLDLTLSAGELADLKTAAFDKFGEEVIKGLEGLSIAGFDLMSIIGGKLEDNCDTLEMKVKRMQEELSRFKDNWGLFLLRKWMETVTKFFKAIGLGKLVEFIGLDFCTFLGIIGFPKSIDLDFTQYVNIDPNLSKGSNLPFKGEYVAIGQVSADTDGIYEFTAEDGQTEFSGTDDNGNTLTFSNINVFVDTVELASSNYSTSTNTVTLNSAASEGDLYLFIPE